MIERLVINASVLLITCSLSRVKHLFHAEIRPLSIKKKSCWLLNIVLERAVVFSEMENTQNSM